MNKERVAAKLKSIQSWFKKPLDCGEKGGGGFAVFTFFGCCNDLWDGCQLLQVRKILLTL